MDNYNFAKKLKDRLRDKDMSQQQLANKTGINRATIANYVSDRSDPPLKKYFIICRELQIEI